MKIQNPVILTLLLIFCSCSLDLQPELEMQKEKMFQTEGGFKNVLTGAYIRMATPELYGENLTLTLTELMAQHWVTSRATTREYIKTFDFEKTSVKNILTTIWLQQYKTVINLNSLLEEIDGKRAMFTNGNYELIKGEALGLRAFIHFEILRLWGDIPSDIVASNPAIPYVKFVTKNPNDLRSLPYTDVLKYILDDLNEAEELLKNDPIRFYSNMSLNSPGERESANLEDDFQYYRQNRFNYYAVLATKARYYLWLGDKANALRYAKEVIEAKNPSSSEKFTLGTNIVAGNYKLTFPTEHIFAVHNSQASKTFTPLFTMEGGYTQTKNNLDNVYEAAMQTSDIRYRDERLWVERPLQSSSQSGTYCYFKKYWSGESSVVDVIPMIRLSELYFIAIECGATEFFTDYRTSRNLTSDLDEQMTDDKKIMARLELEYRKEFYGEGQMFYFYKRNKTTLFTLPVSYVMEPKNYKMPIPQDQSLFE